MESDNDGSVSSNSDAPYIPMLDGNNYHAW